MRGRRVFGAVLLVAAMAAWAAFAGGAAGASPAAAPQATNGTAQQSETPNPGPTAPENSPAPAGAAAPQAAPSNGPPPENPVPPAAAPGAAPPNAAPSAPAGQSAAPQGAAQNPPPSAAPGAMRSIPAGQNPAQSATPQNTAPLGPDQVDAIRILYTGKTMGYFRIPDWQAPTANGEGCKDPARRGAKSDAAAEFDQVMQQEFNIDTTRGAILLSTGDNFSPEIEARDFCDPPPDQPGEGKLFAPVSKELFDWDAGNRVWVRSDAHNAEHPVPADRLFMVPTDNIANFFIREGYAAIVPGKQDFYFGPERVRELARYMASEPIPASARTLHVEGLGTQTLGANLVIETKWKTGHQPLPDSENPPWFIPRFPTATDLLGDAAGADTEVRMSGVSGTVYPWLSGVTLELTGADAATTLAAAIGQTQFYLCEVDSNRPGIPNAIPQPVRQGPCALLERKAGAKPTEVILDFPWIDAKHYYTLKPGANYGLCAVAASARVQAADGSLTFCERFSVYTPFFNSLKETAASDCVDRSTPECQHDPDPYVLIETRDADGIPEDVAIFGVVDPAIGDNVGLLNFAWANTTSRDKFASATQVTDPAEPLQQQLDSFDRSFAEKGYAAEVASGKRWLIKVLMAQMNPQQAQVLGVRLKQFQVIVTAADQELATVGNTENTEWNAPGAGSVRHPMMLEIPEEYFVSGRNPRAVDDIGRLDIRIVPAADPKWELFSTHMEMGKPPDKPVPANTGAAFWAAAETALKRDCLPKTFVGQSHSQEIQILTLCEMQKRTHADVAVLQERDFFAALPEDAGDIPDLGSGTPENMLQQLLDRIIWKGDFLQLLNVPGSALQEAFRQSKSFDAADRSNLSLAEHKQRGLVSVGITYDAAHGEYLVDGVKLNPTQLYSVATSDFIGGGDTGYPDFAGAQVRPPRVPIDFDKTLVSISGAVCRGMAGPEWAAHCMGAIDRDTYLDEVAASPANTGPANTPGETLRTWWIFHRPRPVPGNFGAAGFSPLSLQARADQVVEYRSIWDFKVIRATFAFAGLGHSGTNAQIDSEFGGITTPGVNSHTFDNYTSFFNAEYDRNWAHVQFFAAPAYMFNEQYKGQSGAKAQLNQIANLGTYDMGFARLWAERGPEHRDLLATVHFETPLQETNTVFTLKSTVPSSLTFNQPRSYTLMARGGFRWQRRISSVEFGPEGGSQWGALEGFDFLNNGKVTATCAAKSTLSFSNCVATFSNPSKTKPPTITSASKVESLLGQRAHAGMYWKINLTVPIYTRINYVFTDTGDWFFVGFASENNTDTLFRDIEQHQLRFTIFPSLTVGPEADFLLYENKTDGPLKGNFLRQDQVLLNATFAFNMFNVRKKRDQIEYAPAKGGAQ